MSTQITIRLSDEQVNDLWIAATCAAYDLPVVTQDDDFAALQEGSGVSIIRV